MVPLYSWLTWSGKSGWKWKSILSGWPVTAEYLADRVGIIHRGRLVAEGPPADLVHGTGGLSFLAAPGLPVEQLQTRLQATVHEASPGRYVVDLQDPTPDQVASLTSWLAEHDTLLRELRLGAAGLEEIFLALTDEEST